MNTRWRIINNLAGFLTSQKFSEFCLLSNILNFGGFLKVLKHVNSTITFNDLNFGGFFIFPYLPKYAIFPFNSLIFGGIFDLFAKTPFEHLNFGGSELKLFLIFIATLITTGLVTMGTTSQNLHRPHKCHLAAVCNKTTFPPPTGSPNNKACQL